MAWRVERSKKGPQDRKNLVIASSSLSLSPSFFLFLSTWLSALTFLVRIRLPTRGDRPFNIAGIRLIYECPGYI